MALYTSDLHGVLVTVMDVLEAQPADILKQLADVQVHDVQVVTCQPIVSIIMDNVL